MKPTEDPLTESQLQDLERRGRQALTDASALAGLVASGCLDPELFRPLVAKQLRPIHTGDGSFLVVAVDARGEVRQGPYGPMTATEVATELKKEEAFAEIGWKPRLR